MSDGGGGGGGGGGERVGFMPPLEVFELPNVRDEFVESYLETEDELGLAPEKLSGILTAYEAHLADHGLLKGHEPDIKY